MGTAEIKAGILNDAVFMGVRASVGVIFILHGMGKFNPRVCKRAAKHGTSRRSCRSQ